MFKIGDKARLNSGGPELTVIGISPNGRVWMQWHRADGSLDEASFPPQMLTMITPAPEQMKIKSNSVYMEDINKLAGELTDTVATEIELTEEETGRIFDGFATTLEVVFHFPDYRKHV